MICNQQRAFIILALVAVAAADVSHLESAAQILKQDADVLIDRFHYEYETSNGIIGQAAGQLRGVPKVSILFD